MEELYRSYLSFLRSLDQGLASLTELAEKKLAAAKVDALAALNELLNQEQAQALNFRGLEQARDKLLPRLGLVSVPLSQVPAKFPPALRDEARQAVESLQGRYQAYRKAAGVTRAVLERNLREVEQSLAEMGAPPAPEAGPGYRKEAESAPPPSMKTDFRA